MLEFTPGYVALFQSNELTKRVDRLYSRLSSCNVCARICGINRLDEETGYCHSGLLPIVSSFCAHRGEEPVISGTRGSGTIFFGNCNLRCVFCQNFQISQDPAGQKPNRVSPETLAGQMLSLQEQGCHNINLVSPGHFVPQIVKALSLAAARGLSLPIVYNTNAYDSLETLKELEGIVDIYLPDLKYASDECAIKYSGAPHYVDTAREAIKEMYRQVGELEVDENGIAIKGLIVRHLILPHNISGAHDCLAWLYREVSPDVTLSLMSQYCPTHHAHEFPELAKPISLAEHTEAMRALEDSNIENGWAQELESIEYYLPDFERGGHPFEA